MSATKIRMPRLTLAVLASSALVLGACETLKDAAGRATERDGDSATLVGKLEPAYVPSKLAVGLKRDVMNQRANTLGLISAPEINKYLNGIRAQLVRQSAVTDVPGQVYITADPEINAMATPDGNIFINWGLLRYMRSEDEVASVIAHELAHVLLRHNDSNLVAQYQRITQWYHTQGVVAGAVARNMKGGVQQGGLKKGEMSQLQNVQLLVNLTTKVAAPSWQRTQERSADLLGIDLMIRAGYNPDGMNDMLSVLKQSYEANKKDPNPVEIANLAANVALGNTQQKLGAGVELLAMAFGDDHPDPQTRLTDISGYLNRHYDDADTTPPFRRKPWEAVLKSSQLRKMITAYDGATSARQLLDRNKPKEAYALSLKTVEGARNHAYPAYVHAMTLYGVGKIKEGDAVLRTVLDNADEPSGKVYGLLAQRLEANGRNREALQVTNAGYEKLGRAPQMVPLMVRYQRLSGDPKRASQTASECARELTDYRDICLHEANPPQQNIKTASR